MGTTTTEPQEAPTLRFLVGEWDRESDEMQKLYLGIRPRIVLLLSQAGGCASSTPDENGLCRTYALGLKEGEWGISVLKAGEQLPNGEIAPYCVTQYEQIRKLDDRLRAAATRAMEARRRIGERARELTGEDIAPETLAAAVLVLRKEEDPAAEPRKPEQVNSAVTPGTWTGKRHEEGGTWTWSVECLCGCVLYGEQIVTLLVCPVCARTWERPTGAQVDRTQANASEHQVVELGLLAELIALTMLLEKRGSVCACGFMADGEVYGEPVCLNCRESGADRLRALGSDATREEIANYEAAARWVPFANKALVRRFNRLLRQAEET